MVGFACDVYCCVRADVLGVLRRFVSSLPADFRFVGEGDDPREADAVLERLDSLSRSQDVVLPALYWSRPSEGSHVAYSVLAGALAEGGVVLGCGVLDSDVGSAKRWLAEIAGDGHPIVAVSETPPPRTHSEFLEMRRNELRESGS